MYMKVMENETGNIVAVCDKELIGKVLSEGDVALDLKTYASFYKGDLVDEKKASSALAHGDTVSMNLVGERAVGIAKKLGIVPKGAVMLISGVPHVQVYKI